MPLGAASAAAAVQQRLPWGTVPGRPSGSSRPTGGGSSSSSPTGSSSSSSSPAGTRTCVSGEGMDVDAPHAPQRLLQAVRIIQVSLHHSHSQLTQLVCLRRVGLPGEHGQPPGRQARLLQQPPQRRPAANHTEFGGGLEGCCVFLSVQPGMWLNLRPPLSICHSPNTASPTLPLPHPHLPVLPVAPTSSTWPWRGPGADCLCGRALAEAAAAAGTLHSLAWRLHLGLASTGAWLRRRVGGEPLVSISRATHQQGNRQKKCCRETEGLLSGALAGSWYEADDCASHLLRTGVQ